MTTVLPRFPVPLEFPASLLFILSILIAPAAYAGGTVGSGTAISCTEAALDTALSGGGTVDFDCGASPVTITLTTTKTISATTTVDGGNLVTLDGGGTVQHFSVGTAPTFTVMNIALINGSATYGGAIYSLWAGNTLVVTNSTFTNNHSLNGGGAIRTIGSSLTVTGSTFSGNSTTNLGAAGGAIEHSVTTASITNSTFSGNGAGASTSGGAISAEKGTTTITNSTFSGNSSGNGTGGVEAGNSGTSVILINTILTANTPANCRVYNTGTFTDGGNNLQFGGTVVNSCGVTVPTADPLLDPLSSNGGPTQTMALAAGSPAIDAGNNANCPVADQRGVARYGAACDIGAYEYVPAVVITTPAAPVPALSEWALILLAGMLGMFGSRVMQRREGVAN